MPFLMRGGDYGDGRGRTQGIASRGRLSREPRTPHTGEVKPGSPGIGRAPTPSHTRSLPRPAFWFDRLADVRIHRRSLWCRQAHGLPASHFRLYMKRYNPNVRVRRLEKPVIWIGSSHKDLMALPIAVRKFFGFALSFARRGEHHDSAKALRGFGDAGVLAG